MPSSQRTRIEGADHSYPAQSSLGQVLKSVADDQKTWRMSASQSALGPSRIVNADVWKQLASALLGLCAITSLSYFPLDPCPLWLPGSSTQVMRGVCSQGQKRVGRCEMTLIIGVDGLHKSPGLIADCYKMNVELCGHPFG